MPCLEDFKDYKIELNNTNVMYFENFWNKEVCGGTIQKVQSLDTKDFYLKIKIRKERENKDLIIGNGFGIITNLKTEGKKETNNFCQYVSKYLEGKKIEKIEQINLEKIIVFEFEDYKLYFEFFSNKNMVFTDKENIILACLHQEEWKTRIIRRNSEYLLPQPNFANIANYEPNEKDIDTKKNLVSNIVRNTNVSPKLIEKLILYKKINKEKFIFKEYKVCVGELKKYYKKIKLKNVNYLTVNQTLDIFNIEIPFLEELNLTTNKILDEIIVKNAIYSAQNQIIEELSKKNRRLCRILAEQRQAKEKFEKKAVEYKNKGDLIYKNFELVSEVWQEIKNKQRNKPLKEIEKELEERKTGIKTPVFKLDAQNQKIIFILESLRSRQ